MSGQEQQQEQQQEQRQKPRAATAFPAIFTADPPGHHDGGGVNGGALQPQQQQQQQQEHQTLPPQQQQQQKEQLRQLPSGTSVMPGTLSGQASLPSLSQQPSSGGASISSGYPAVFASSSAGSGTGGRLAAAQMSSSTLSPSASAAAARGGDAPSASPLSAAAPAAAAAAAGGLPSSSGAVGGSSGAGGVASSSALPLPHGGALPSTSASSSAGPRPASAPAGSAGAVPLPGHLPPPLPLSAPADYQQQQHQQQQQKQQQQQRTRPPAPLSPAGVAAAAVASVQTTTNTDTSTAAAASAAAIERPLVGDDLRASCPMLCVVGTNQGAPRAVPLSLLSLSFRVRCHLSVAFVEVQLVCMYPATWNEAPLVLFCPKTADTTITELTVENMVRPSVFATAVVPLEDAARYSGGASGKGGSAGGAAAAGGGDDGDAGGDPELLALPLPPGLPGDQLRARVSYFQPMAFDAAAGRYTLVLPSTVPPECLSHGVSVNSVLDVAATVNTGEGGEGGGDAAAGSAAAAAGGGGGGAGSGEVDLVVRSHPVAISDSRPGSITFALDAASPWPNADFVCGYRVWRDALAASLHVEAPRPGLADQRGTFALAVTPPGPERSVCFPRSLVFLLDRSGSMAGEPLRCAKAALLTGLRALGPGDRFTVVAFDHEQLWWTDRLIEGSRDNVLACMRWVHDELDARGTTDIAAPLARALKLLSLAPGGLPCVYLITDGCVDDERGICVDTERVVAAARAAGGGASTANGAAAAPSPPPMISATVGGGNGALAPADSGAAAAAAAVCNGNGNGNGNGQQQLAPNAAAATAPRVFTFGIGPYCNHYFLKRLAAVGRGMSDVAFRPHAIQPGVERMLAAAALPLLADVELRVEGLTGLELYPNPIPDVFVGAPLLVSGKFEGDWPEAVELRGVLPDGTVWRQTVPSLPAGGLPLHQVFVKSQLDLMTAAAWAAGNPPALVRRVVDLSVAAGVPSAHTAMVGFETTPERFAAMQGAPRAERRKRVAKWAIGGAAGVGVVAGVAAALAFGDAGATLANLPVGDAMAALGGDLGALMDGVGASLDCCGGCECCGECGDLCGACLTC